MDEVALAKCSCGHCGIHLEFPRMAAGTEIDCPQCNLKTILTLPEDFDPALATDGLEPKPALATVELLADLTGTVPRTPVSLLYRAGLALVATMMILLPAIYVAMIGAAGWATWWWATHFTFLLHGAHRGPRLYLFQLMCYIGPLFAGLVLVFFMVKPLFARHAPRAQPLALNPGAEPLLFAFIARICEIVGAPMPKRIDLDCQLNASASFRRGGLSLFSNDLVLTIGLPLAAGLTLREFAGVLAHEFGHFTQGFGMRLCYIIRSVNAWFARVVYERDAWDLALEEWAQTEEGWLAILVGLTRLAVWFSRQLLKLLMLVGHGIGCFMLRQMEYDADSYEIKVAGSDTFESALRRMYVLSLLLEKTYKDIRTSWNLNRHLPDDFPAYLLEHDHRLSNEQRTKIEDCMGLKATEVFETHPSNGDRIRCARQANEPGVFHRQEPASALFTNFEIPAKQVTLLHYSDDLGIPLVMAKLRPVKESHPSSEETSSPEEVTPELNSTPRTGLRLKLRKRGGTS